MLLSFFLDDNMARAFPAIPMLGIRKEEDDEEEGRGREPDSGPTPDLPLSEWARPAAHTGRGSLPPDVEVPSNQPPPPSAKAFQSQSQSS